MSDDLGLWTVPLAILGGAIRVSTPFLFVSLGETITERSGRINLGLEGTLVFGAMSAYATAVLTNSPWAGVAVAGLAGGLFGLLHGYICKFPKVNDVAIGIALMLFGTGLAFFSASPSSSLPRRRSRHSLRGVVGPAAGPGGAAGQRAVPGGAALSVTLWWGFRNTKAGLILRVVGDSADAARALGYDVDRVRLATVATPRVLAGSAARTSRSTIRARGTRASPPARG